MTTVTTNDTVDASATSLRRLGLKTHPAALIGRYGALVFLLLIVLIGSIMRPDTFATVSNLINILNQSSLTAIIAIGLTFVLVTGDFDVSIGYVASISGMIVTSFINDGFSIPSAILLTALCGVAVGLANGFIVT